MTLAPPPSTWRHCAHAAPSTTASPALVVSEPPRIPPDGKRYPPPRVRASKAPRTPTLKCIPDAPSPDAAPLPQTVVTARQIGDADRAATRRSAP